VNVDVVKVVKVIPIESAKYKHITSKEAGTVTPSRLGCVSGHFQISYCIALWVQHEDITEIVAEPASIDVDLILVDRGSVSPPCEEGAVFHASLPPI
jgi:hypothetical protein